MREIRVADAAGAHGLLRRLTRLFDRSSWTAVNRPSTRLRAALVRRPASRILLQGSSNHDERADPMMKHARTMLSTFVLTIALAALAGPAYAGGNGNDNGGGNAQAVSAQPASSPGNSGNAPGKANSGLPAATGQSDPGSNAPGNSENAPGQQAESKSSGSASAAAAEPAAKGSQPGKTKASARGNSTNTPDSPGLKPTNSTERNFSAPAGSKLTKRYGNGQTAGQIAMQHGASPDTPLYSPGNSQPHKVASCAQPLHGNGGGIDVHALKHRGAKACADGQSSTPPAADAPGTPLNGREGGTADSTSAPSAPEAPKAPAATRPATPTAAAAAESAIRTAQAEPTDAAAGGVLGAAAGGVLGAVATVSKGTLPFTGFSLPAVALVALVLLGSGLALRYRARATA
jgi:hypothetical protein